MIKRCSWCQGVYGTKPPLDDPRVTYGICLGCYGKQILLPLSPTRAYLCKLGIMEWDESQVDYDIGGEG